MDTRTEVLITPHGLFRATTNFVPLDINAAIVSQFSSTATRKVMGLLPGEILKGGPKRNIGLCAGPSHSCWTIEIDNLPLNTSYMTTEDGKTVYPVFTEPNLPSFNLFWRTPRNMRLCLLVMLGASSEHLGQFLVAVDDQMRFYQLPLSNLYDDCKLCAGKFTEKLNTPFDALNAAWLQFLSSRWQGDLYQSGKQANTRSLFSYTVEKDTFEQQFPTDGSMDWTRMCVKIGNETITNNISINQVKPTTYA